MLTAMDRSDQPDPGGYFIRAPGGELAAAGPVATGPFGPVVRRRWGDPREIFGRDSASPVSQLKATGGVLAAFWAYFLVVDSNGFPTGPLAFTAAMSFPAVRALKRWREQRRLARVPLLQAVAPPAALVRIAGTIEACREAFLGPGTERPVVYARTLVYEPGHQDRPGATAREEIRGVPFRVRLPDGRSVKLRPDDLDLENLPVVSDVPAEVLQTLGAAHRPARFRRKAHFSQVTLAPGDEVEAAGLLHAEIDPSGVAAPSRGAPLALVLVPPPEGVVWIRRVLADSATARLAGSPRQT